MAAIRSPAAAFQYLLVTNPFIANFQFNPSQTIGASFSLLITVLSLYLSLTLLLRHLLPPRPSPLPSLRRVLRVLSPLHNAAILFLSLAMSLGCSLSAAYQMPSLSWLFCFPPHTLPAGPTFFWAHIFYLSKIYELVDTLLIILASDPRRLSFLHVYHHAVVLIMSRLWITDVQSLMPIALVTNSSVHVVMYGYYLCSSLGWRWSPRWKRVVTNCQIIQFCFSFLVSLVFLWLHFIRGGCSGFEAWCFNGVFNGSLLFLFLDFHRKNYRGIKRKDAGKKN